MHFRQLNNYLLMNWVWWIAININLESLFGTLSLNDMAQAFIYLLGLPNFINFHKFNGFPYISWISIYFMDFYIFNGFPYIFMKLTEFYKILQFSKRTFVFFKYFWTNYNTLKMKLEKFFKTFLKKLQHQNEDTCKFFQKVSEKLKHLSNFVGCCNFLWVLDPYFIVRYDIKNCNL